jgi:hypothetical protein
MRIQLKMKQCWKQALYPIWKGYWWWMLFILMMGSFPYWLPMEVTTKEKNVWVLFLATLTLFFYGGLILDRQYRRTKRIYERRIQRDMQAQGYPFVSFYRYQPRHRQFICSTEADDWLIKVSPTGKIERQVHWKGGF